MLLVASVEGIRQPRGPGAESIGIGLEHLFQQEVVDRPVLDAVSPQSGDILVGSRHDLERSIEFQFDALHEMIRGFDRQSTRAGVGGLASLLDGNGGREDHGDRDAGSDHQAELGPERQVASQDRRPARAWVFRRSSVLHQMRLRAGIGAVDESTKTLSVNRVIARRRLRFSRAYRRRNHHRIGRTSSGPPVGGRGGSRRTKPWHRQPATAPGGASVHVATEVPVASRTS